MVLPRIRSLDQAMPVGRHGDEVALFAVGRLENLGGWIAEREVGRNRQALAAQRLGDGLEVDAVVLHLLGLRQLEPVEVARHPPVGHVHQEAVRQ